jgi:hypothetical protein
LGLTEAGAIVPVTLATFGMPATTLSNNLVQPLIAHPAVIAFLQGTVLLAGGFLVIVLLGKISRQPWLQLVPQLGAIGGFTILLWHLILT